MKTRIGFLAMSMFLVGGAGCQHTSRHESAPSAVLSSELETSRQDYQFFLETVQKGQTPPAVELAVNQDAHILQLRHELGALNEAMRKQYPPFEDPDSIELKARRD